MINNNACLKVLIGQGADLTTPDKEGWTAIHCAASAGYLDVVKLLVESGASADVMSSCDQYQTMSPFNVSAFNQKWQNSSVVCSQ